LPNLLFNRKFIGDLWAHFTYKIEIFQHEPIAVTRAHDFGFASSADTAPTLYLDEVKLKRSVSKPPLAKLAQDFHSNFSRVHLRKISELCHKNKIKITFLYMPSYGILMASLRKNHSNLRYIRNMAVCYYPRKIFMKIRKIGMMIII
jgi:hypothetical protein